MSCGNIKRGIMKAKLITYTIASNGREIWIRSDEIVSITKESFDESRGYWTAKITMSNGKEIVVSDSYDSIIKEWTEFIKLINL